MFETWQMSFFDHDSVKFVQSCYPTCMYRHCYALLVSILFNSVFDSATALLQMHPVQMRWLVCVLSFEAADLSPEEPLLVTSKIIQHHLMQVFWICLNVIQCCAALCSPFWYEFRPMWKSQGGQVDFAKFVKGIVSVVALRHLHISHTWWLCLKSSVFCIQHYWRSVFSSDLVSNTFLFEDIEVSWSLKLSK